MKREIFFTCLIIVLSLAIRETMADQVNYAASGSRDPFENQLPRVEPKTESQVSPVVEEPREKVKASLPAISVESMISGGPVPQAIIRGGILRVGDQIEGATITKITKEGVELLYQGETFVVPAPSKTIGYSQGGKNAK